jgi:hypothetical protein
MADQRPELRNPFAPSRESLIDRQIREAQEAGAFDDLPHQGQKLPLVDDSAAGEWALAYRMLRNANFAPPWIEADKVGRCSPARRRPQAGAAVIGHRAAAGSRRADRDRASRQRRLPQVNREAPRNGTSPTAGRAELATLDRAHRR